RSVPEGPLPETKVTRGDVEVAGQAGELFRRDRLVTSQLLCRIEVPAVQHRDAAPGVADRECQVDRLLARLGHAAASGRLDPLAFHERDLLRRILESRRDQ